MHGCHKLGKLVLGLVFIIFGINHFVNPAALTGLVPSYIPGGVVWVYITGIILVLGGLAILANRWTKIFAGLVALQLLIFVVLIHIPNATANIGTWGGALKDLGLMAGAMLLARN